MLVKKTLNMSESRKNTKLAVRRSLDLLYDQKTLNNDRIMSSKKVIDSFALLNFINTI